MSKILQHLSPQNLTKWTILGLLSLIFMLLVPTQSAISIDSQLEEQVLEIIRKHPEVIIESVQTYQQQQKKQLQQTWDSFLQDLKTQPRSVIGESPMTGSKELKTVVVEFSDFQCPYCAQANKTLKELLAKYRDKLTLVYKFFPLNQIHPQALPAAKAAWAANQQGKFWEYHDALFTSQNRLGEALYLDIAKNLDLNLEKFGKDRDLADAAIQKDVALGEKLRVSGTPTFVVGSQNFSGAVDLSGLTAILERGQ